MRFSKGKWVPSRKDLWDIDTALSPIIRAWLVKFKENLEKDPFAGIPSLYFNQGFNDQLIMGMGDEDPPAVKEAFQRYLADIDECIWVFTEDNEDEYLTGELSTYEQYYKRKQAALNLFAKLYIHLWS